MKRTIAFSATVALGLTVFFVALVYMVPHVEAGEMICGKVSWYGRESGDHTATGEYFDGSSLTMAMPVHSHLLRMGGRYRVHYGSKHVDVRVNDTGGFAKYGRIADLSRAAAVRIGLIGRGVGTVCLERLAG